MHLPHWEVVLSKHQHTLCLKMGPLRFSGAGLRLCRCLQCSRSSAEVSLCKDVSDCRHQTGPASGVCFQQPPFTSPLNRKEEESISRTRERKRKQKAL